MKYFQVPLHFPREDIETVHDFGSTPAQINDIYDDSFWNRTRSGSPSAPESVPALSPSLSPSPLGSPLPPLTPGTPGQATCSPMLDYVTECQEADLSASQRFRARKRRFADWRRNSKELAAEVAAAEGGRNSTDGPHPPSSGFTSSLAFWRNKAVTPETGLGTSETVRKGLPDRPAVPVRASSLPLGALPTIRLRSKARRDCSVSTDGSASTSPGTPALNGSDDHSTSAHPSPNSNSYRFSSPPGPTSLSDAMPFRARRRSQARLSFPQGFGVHRAGANDRAAAFNASEPCGIDELVAASRDPFSAKHTFPFEAVLPVQRVDGQESDHAPLHEQTISSTSHPIPATEEWSSAKEECQQSEEQEHLELAMQEQRALLAQLKTRLPPFSSIPTTPAAEPDFAESPFDNVLGLSLATTQVEEPALTSAAPSSSSSASVLRLIKPTSAIVQAQLRQRQSLHSPEPATKDALETAEARGREGRKSRWLAGSEITPESHSSTPSMLDSRLPFHSDLIPSAPSSRSVSAGDSGVSHTNTDLSLSRSNSNPHDLDGLDSVPILRAASVRARLPSARMATPAHSRAGSTGTLSSCSHSHYDGLGFESARVSPSPSLRGGTDGAEPHSVRNGVTHLEYESSVSAGTSGNHTPLVSAPALSDEFGLQNSNTSLVDNISTPRADRFEIASWSDGASLPERSFSQTSPTSTQTEDLDGASTLQVAAETDHIQSQERTTNSDSRFDSGSDRALDLDPEPMGEATPIARTSTSCLSQRVAPETPTPVRIRR